MTELSAGQLCLGARAIAAVLGGTPRQIYHLAATRQIPAFKFGRTIGSPRAALLELVKLREAEASAALSTQTRTSA